MRYWNLIALLAFAGCEAKPERVAVVPVSGSVRVGGKPAEGVRVFLVPESAPTVPAIPANPRGQTGPDGTFSLGTYAADDGAAPGGYQVVLFWPAAVGEGDEESEVDQLRGWYDQAHTQLAAKVGEGPTTLPAFDLPQRDKPPQFQEGIPGRN